MQAKGVTMNSAERVPGEPAYVRKLWRGELAMPALTTARAKWDARQAAISANDVLRSRMLVGILDQFIAEIGEERARQWTLAEVRARAAILIENGEAHE